MSAVLQIERRDTGTKASDRTAPCPHGQHIEDADNATRQAIQAIRMIPAHLFNERAAMNLIAQLQARITASNWSHREHAIDADEYLTSAHFTLENAAEAQEAEE